jgi:hypothetical protein
MHEMVSPGLVEGSLLFFSTLRYHIIKFDSQHQSNDQAEDESSTQEEAQKEVYYILVFQTFFHFQVSCDTEAPNNHENDPTSDNQFLPSLTARNNQR